MTQDLRENQHTIDTFNDPNANAPTEFEYKGKKLLESIK